MSSDDPVTPVLHVLAGPAPATSAGPGDPDGGPALLLLHAFPLDHRMWTDVAPRVHGAGRVLAVDLPEAGTEAAAAPAGPPSLEAAADGIAAAVRAAGVDRVVVAGLSMGGYVALALLERHADLVAGLALVDTKAAADTGAARAKRLRVAEEAERTGGTEHVLAGVDDLLAEGTRQARPAVVEQVRAWARDQSPRSIAWAQRAMAARPDRTAVLAAWPGPVLVAVGDEDAVTPPAGAGELAAAARDAVLVVVEGAGHLSAVERPDTVADALSDLLARCR
ncbi:alpha/beta fold hydrolase [Cellulomonas marina]|uniref:Pimeloyl-ACP methyl ester carboxylesterase n=1 Tax=Cellulomonas marina TaxID=988821 RepID=A0A1I1AT74_9CELL|nr:alpha/beta fold hydrolase [Cellulomonas marina]GIG30232.1 hydrolase [Cellulomonas marina]SFB41275.1 Pimeloyl-ACP methyl ester carboxylesterase [Cellulomonas marina]